MKLIIKLDPTVGQLVKRLKRKVNNLIYRLFKKPYQDYIQSRLEKKRVQKIHAKFERIFGLKAKKVVDIMRRSDVAGGFLRKPVIKMSDEEYKALLLEQLKQSAHSLNEMKPYIKASLFYDPDITDIHNESIEEGQGLSLKELMARDFAEARKTLLQQGKRTPVLNVVPKQSTQFPKAPSMTRETDLTAIKNAGGDTIQETLSKSDVLAELLGKKS